jgi:Coenzyme PQQ synthesis protein D (PqqD)
MASETGGGRFRPSPDAVVERLDGEVVLVHMKTDRIFSLNATGTRVWELLSTGLDVRQIQRQVLEEFEGAEDTVKADVDDLLEALHREKLITPDE